ncbi:MAG: hypothetical protein HY547_08340 [Elusimicrobia bacterium]|nr:hypothetical protein [Elusimicrobiota bacterium]
MGKILFVIGLLAGWLLASIQPPPAWLTRRLKRIFHKGADRVTQQIEQKVQEEKISFMEETKTATKTKKNALVDQMEKKMNLELKGIERAMDGRN